MYKYSVKILKVSGRLNESVLPKKNLVVKSKRKKSDEQIFDKVSKYINEKYGLEVNSAEVICEGFFGNLLGKKQAKEQTMSQQPQQERQYVKISNFPELQQPFTKNSASGCIIEFNDERQMEEWNKLPKDVSPPLVSLDELFANEFIAAQNWAAELTSQIQSANSENVNDVINRALNGFNIGKQISVTENQSGYVYDVIENRVKNIDSAPHPQIREYDVQDNLNMLAKFRKTFIDFAKLKGLRDEYIKKFNNLISKIQSHYKQAKLIKSIFDSKIQNGLTAAAQCAIALSA
jgi:hypothetical protein